VSAGEARDRGHRGGAHPNRAQQLGAFLTGERAEQQRLEGAGWQSRPSRVGSLASSQNQAHVPGSDGTRICRNYVSSRRNTSYQGVA
jgi:hypothetical protein